VFQKCLSGWTARPSGAKQIAEKLLARAAPQSPSAAKAVTETRPVIAAVNRCATQKQEQKSSFSALCKARIFVDPWRHG